MKNNQFTYGALTRKGDVKVYCCGCNLENNKLERRTNHTRKKEEVKVKLEESNIIIVYVVIRLNKVNLQWMI